MLNRRVIAIIKRELKMKLFSRSFILMTLLIPLFMFGIIGIQVFIRSLSEDAKANLIVLSESEELLQKLDIEFSRLADVKSKNFNVSYQLANPDSFQAKLDYFKNDLLNEKLTGVIYIPTGSLQSKEVEYFSSNPNNSALFSKVKPAINKCLTDIYFSSRQMTLEEINFARRDVNFKGYRVTKDEKVQEEGIGNQIALFLFSFLLYIALIFAGQMTLSSVVEEKNSRIVEVLLSSATSTDLMAGKILGTVIVEVLQMAIWLTPVVMLISTSWFMLPAELTLQLDITYIIYFLVNYTIGLITFVGLFATVGAIFDNTQDAQSGLWPVMMLIMIPFFIAISLQTNAQSTFAKIASMFPFASIIVMPARMTLVEVPIWQIALSFIINVAVLFAIFPVAGKIYRIGILTTGKKPKWSEVIKWVKMSS